VSRVRDAAPITPDLTAVEGRDRFLAAFGLDTTGYTAPDFPVKPFRGVTLRFPNPGLLHFHDLHHVATGYGATVLGEAEVSAFELRAGCPSPLVRFLCCGAVLIGLCRAPRRVIRAWRGARGTRSLYAAGIAYETLLAMPVAELRRFVHVPEEGCPGAVWEEGEPWLIYTAPSR
jgi:hypothetical protein